MAFEDYGWGMVIDTDTGDVYDSNTGVYLDNDAANFFGQDYVSQTSGNQPYAGWEAPNFNVNSDGSVTFQDGTQVLPDGSISYGGQTYTVEQAQADPSLWDRITGVVGSSNFGKVLGIAGAGISGYLSNNAAAKAGYAANQQALSAQNAGADQAQRLQREQFEYSKKLNEPFYNRGLKGFEQYSSAITGEPDSTGRVWNPIESPAYQWQQQQTEKNNGRSLRALGRENSSYGMNVQADSNRSLAVSEYDKQLNRLADLTNVARGGAASLTSSSGNYGNNAGNLAVQTGENIANSSLAGAYLQQNNANNNIKNLYGLADVGLKMFGK